jgi:hypothetical protein
LPPIADLHEKLEKAIALKDYALAANFDVPEDIIKRLNKVAFRKGSLTSEDLADEATDIDTVIRDLTEITYPTTIHTLFLSGDSPKQTRAFKVFSMTLVALGICGLVFAIIGYWEMWALQAPEALAGKKAWESIVALSLGLLGSLVYILFNMIGILSEKAFEVEDTFSNYARLILGPIIGWVFYITFGQEVFSNPSKTSPLMLLPFLAGFSTKLVVGIITQALKAIELTLGLEDKTTQLAQRKVKRRSNQPAAPSSKLAASSSG